MGRRIRRAFATLVTLSLLLVSTFALAAEEEWKPPTLRTHVVDSAHALSPNETRSLERKLDRIRRQTGFAIVVYLLQELPQGLSIEDVGYKAGNAWGVGSEAGDDGVLLIASLGDRKLRIETGRGVGGALTDLQSSRISREVIGPLLKQGHVYAAMDRGVDAIARELVENTSGGVSEPGRNSSHRRDGQLQPMTQADYVKAGVGGLVLLGVIILAIVSPTFRSILFWILLFGRGGGGGGGFGGGGGGGGYGGGGGSFGGGGSSDDY